MKKMLLTGLLGLMGCSGNEQPVLMPKYECLEIKPDRSSLNSYRICYEPTDTLAFKGIGTVQVVCHQTDDIMAPYRPNWDRAWVSNEDSAMRLKLAQYSCPTGFIINADNVEYLDPVTQNLFGNHLINFRGFQNVMSELMKPKEE